MSAPRIVVNVTSDILCPFCWIGKKQLEKAMAERRGVEFKVVWHPFFLSKEVGEAGEDKLERYCRKFGAERGRFMLLDPESPVKKFGREVGIEFNYTKGCLVANTMKGHRLLWYVNDKYGWKKQNELMEVIFRQYFKENRDMNSMDTLTTAAKEVGISESETTDFLLSDKLVAEVDARHRDNQANMISGVPHFRIEHTPASATKPRYLEVSGAQPVPQFLRAFDTVLGSEPL